MNDRRENDRNIGSNESVLEVKAAPYDPSYVQWIDSSRLVRAY